MLTTDKWMIYTVKGCQIPIVNHPVQESQPNAPRPRPSNLNGKGAVKVCRREFLFDSLSNFKERRSVEASHKPQETGQMGGIPALQNEAEGNY